MIHILSFNYVSTHTECGDSHVSAGRTAIRIVMSACVICSTLIPVFIFSILVIPKFMNVILQWEWISATYGSVQMRFNGDIDIKRTVGSNANGPIDTEISVKIRFCSTNKIRRAILTKYNRD